MEEPLGEISPGLSDRAAQSELFDGDQNLSALQEQVSILGHRKRSLETRLQQRSYMGLLSATTLKRCIDASNRLEIEIDNLSRTYEAIEDLISKIKFLNEGKQNLEVIFQKTKKEVGECNEKKKRLMRMLRDGKGKEIETGSEQNAAALEDENETLKIKVRTVEEELKRCDEENRSLLKQLGKEREQSDRLDKGKQIQL